MPRALLLFYALASTGCTQFLNSYQAPWKRGDPDDNPVVHVEVEGQPDGTQLQQIDESASGWVDVCRAPCESRLDRATLYRMSGGLWTRSDPFRLPAAEEVTIRARPGSGALSILSVILGSGSGVVLGSAIPDVFDSHHRATSALLIAGGALGIAASMLIADASTIRVQIESAPP
jgi:hypothetical protein